MGPKKDHRYTIEERAMANKINSNIRILSIKGIRIEKVINIVNTYEAKANGILPHF